MSNVCAVSGLEDLHARYDELFDVYKGIYPTLAGLNKRIIALELG